MAQGFTGGAADRLVAVDVGATADYIGAASGDGVLRVGALMTYADGGNFVTINTNEAALTHDNLIAGTIASHDTTATGANLNTLTGAGDVGALHTHAAAYAPISGAVGVAQFTVANEAADATCFPVFVTAAAGDLPPKSNAGLTYDSTSSTLSSTLLAGALNGTVGATTPAAGSFTGVTMTGDIVLGGDNDILTDVTPSATDTWSGITATMTVDVNTVGIGGLLHLDTDSNWVDADMNATTSMPGMAIATTATIGSTVVMLQGVIRDTGWAWTIGGIVYANTSGTMTQTAPAGSGDQVQVVGIALTADTILFNPSPVLVEVA